MSFDVLQCIFNGLYYCTLLPIQEKRYWFCELPCIRAKIVLQKSAFCKFSYFTRAVHEKEKVIQKSGLYESHSPGSLKIIIVLAGAQQGVKRDPPYLRPGAKYTLWITNLVPSVLSPALCNTIFSGVLDPCHQLKIYEAANSSRATTEQLLS